MSIISGMNITVRDSVFEHHTTSAPFAGVDIEPNAVPANHPLCRLRLFLLLKAPFPT